jgi:hypothetical protein
MADIVLERESSHNVMKLDPAEEALLNNIEISTELPVPKPKPKPKRQTLKRPPPSHRVEQAQENLDAFTNPTKMSAPPPPQPEMMADGTDSEDGFMAGTAGGWGGDDDEGDEYEEAVPQSGGGVPASRGYTSVDDEKADLLNKLNRLEKKGFSVNKRLNAYSNVEELRTEYKRIKYSIEVDQSLKFSRRMLIACVTGVEFLNKRYDPLNIQLDGWSESVMENVDDYDGVFEELYNKYKTKVNVAPEVKLIMMLGGSAMMFHLTNSMFKSAIPNMNDVMKQNPDLVKNMISAVQQTKPSTGPVEDPTTRPVSTDGRREMKGPGLDLSSLMGGVMMPPAPPMNTSKVVVDTEGGAVDVDEDDDEDDMSDIVSIAGESTGGEVREVSVSGKKRGGGGRKKKKEISL